MSFIASISTPYSAVGSYLRFSISKPSLLNLPAVWLNVNLLSLSPILSLAISAKPLPSTLAFVVSVEALRIE